MIKGSLVDIKQNIENTKQPLITVAVTIYNIKEYLQRSIESVCNQTHRTHASNCILGQEETRQRKSTLVRLSLIFSWKKHNIIKLFTYEKYIEVINENEMLKKIIIELNKKLYGETKWNYYYIALKVSHIYYEKI